MGQKILVMCLSLATGQSGRTWEAWQGRKGRYQKPALFLGAVGRNATRGPCSDCGSEELPSPRVAKARQQDSQVLSPEAKVLLHTAQRGRTCCQHPVLL